MDLAAVSSVLATIEKLTRVTQQVTSLFGVDEQIESLERELRWMQSFLKVADSRKVDNEVIRMSVAEIRELAYDAEDVIETFSLKVASKRKGGFSGCIKRSACLLKEGFFLHRIKSKMAKITMRIKELTRQLQTYDVTKLGDQREGASSSTERRESRRPYPHIAEYNIVGLDADIKKLVSVLVEEESECKVVSICGMGGLGKTTLAKKVYRHNQVIGHFNNNLVWVYVSQQCQKRKVWEDILSGLKNLDKGDKNKRDEEVAEKLCNLLKDKKCMVILDDVWSIEAWDSLKPAFPVARDNHSSSKMLLTSRNTEIVSHADPRGYLHELQFLNQEQSLELFQNIALPAANSTENRVDPKMKHLGEGMVKHCAGLPLAIIVLGGILATKNNSLNEWLKVSANVKSFLKRGKSQGLLLEDVLALSYDDLPPYLRPCFLYFSIFPEDYGIPMDRLIQLLVAEGIVSTKQEEEESGEIAEDLAEGYLMELVERCMIQVRERDIATLKVRTFEMHDLMRVLCLSKAKQENFIFIVDQSNACSLSVIRRVRRVSGHEFFRTQCIRSPNLRSLFFFGTPKDESIVPQTLGNYLDNHGLDDSLLLWMIVFTLLVCIIVQAFGGIWRYVFNNFKLLRVLDYESEDDMLRKLPSDVGNLIHLRFLRLRGVSLFCPKIPSSLGNLRCLQTLDLRVRSMSASSSSIHVPNVIWRMEQLRHLYLPEECSRKTKLKLDTLRNIQTLVNFNTKNCYLKDLINMTNLRVLVIQGPFNIDDFNEEELDKNPPIIQATCLHSLSILCRDPIDPRHLTHLLSSCASICALNFDAQISKLPEHHHLSLNLAFISLKSCGLQGDSMAELEKLPNLRSLELHSGAFIGKEILCSAQGFPKLVSLTLHDLDCLEEWKVDEGAIPSLQRLEIEKCTKLKMLPDGLRSITSLQDVKMKSMPKEFNDKVMQGGEDFYKVQHVPSVIVLDGNDPSNTGLGLTLG